ncbi:flagellar hook-associated protein 3 FlgL [Rhizomicrobium palustre]|uniref:Flagellar hook-associated protein 3 FlgL n=1 Tax=Rhizomicrobium palustre TaxID=189966 RepID=A0A846MX43_9PROT|nr:flagellin [Rhizomicrobium palustre]NIK87795.1 flagellar hook-associated protein 3 FlgL [Rhizomicrobium palustre]
MSVDRVASNSQTNYMLTQIAKANSRLQDSETQLSSGKVSTTYAGIGDKTAALEGARVAGQRADAYKASTQLAITQTDLQDTQLTSLSGLAAQLSKAIQSATANSDGTDLMNQANSIFQQAASILNSTDANGSYIYGGSLTDRKPFTATKLSDLASGSVSSFFQNDTNKKTVQTGDGQTETIGVLASDVGTDLMKALQTLYNLDGGTGSYSAKLTATQTTALTNTALPDATTANSKLNSLTALNGDTYNNLKSAVTTQQTMSNLYSGFVSDIEDVDMAKALTNLSSNQVALQAVLSVTAKLNNLSLLDYMPTR